MPDSHAGLPDRTGEEGDMVRQSSPAKGHRTGHYATSAPFGSNGNFCQRASGWQK